MRKEDNNISKVWDEEGAKSFTAKEAAQALPLRPFDGHKGTFGKVCIIGGSVGLTGAPVLAAGAAARTGSGLVYLGVPGEIYPITATMCLEAMPFPLKDSKGKLSKEALFGILERMNTCDAGLIGPGMGRSQELEILVRRLLKQVESPLVIDADALYAIRKNKKVIKDRSEKGRVTILTPHEGEFAYLGGRLTKYQAGNKDPEIQAERNRERIQAAKSFARDHGCILVLKGPNTVTADPDGSIWINTTGNNGMAKGGSGDILAGVTTSLLGQHLEPTTAAALAAWIHGHAGDLCQKELGEFGMLPQDILKQLPAAIYSLQKNTQKNQEATHNN